MSLEDWIFPERPREDDSLNKSNFRVTSIMTSL